jgi:UDP-2,4-diacetamido-2,4,6-trideoxy-beta-L-altropyranose hydrolase
VSIAFRTVASKAVGFGHLRRCLTLATELRVRARTGTAIHFWIEGAPEAAAMAIAAGFDARSVAGSEPETTAALVRLHGASIVVVDSYDVPEASFAVWRTQLRRLVAIDDLADRFLDADTVINPSPHAKRLRYRTGPGCLLLLGPEYALLRAPFRDLPQREISSSVRRVLVTLGGADPAGSTPAVVAATLRALPRAEVDVVAGPLFGSMPGLETIVGRAADRLRIHHGLSDLATLMRKADFAVSGGGQTLFELAATGLPAVAVRLAPNQESNIATLEGVTLLGAGAPPDAARPDASELEDACRRLAGDHDLRVRLSRAGQALVDGRGALRAAEAILGAPRPSVARLN